MFEGSLAVRVYTIDITVSRKTIAPSRNPCDPDFFCSRLAIEHRCHYSFVFRELMWSRCLCLRLAIRHRCYSSVRLQGTNVTQKLCSHFWGQASIRSPAEGHLYSFVFFPDRGIYDAAIILGRIQGGTEPMWSRCFCTRLTIGHGRQFAHFPSTVEHRPTQVQFSERDHARATRASLLAGMLPGLRMSALCALHLKRVYFCVFCAFFLLVFLFFVFRRLSVEISHTHNPP